MTSDHQKQHRKLTLFRVERNLPSLPYRFRGPDPKSNLTGTGHRYV